MKNWTFQPCKPHHSSRKPFKTASKNPFKKETAFPTGVFFFPRFSACEKPAAGVLGQATKHTIDLADLTSAQKNDIEQLHVSCQAKENLGFRFFFVFFFWVV